MVVIETQKTSSDEIKQAVDEKAFAEKLVNKFDLPASLQDGIEEAEKEAAEEPKEEEVQEAKEEVVSEKAEDSVKTETEESEAEEDEELIPKSKFQKRLDEMTREKKLLEIRLKALEEKANSVHPQVDEDTLRLQNMSEEELGNLKRQVRLSQIKSAGDEVMVNKLLELEDKIDAVRITAPQRLSQNQVAKFKEAVSITNQEIPNFEKAQKDIFALAKNIYDSTPELHKAVTGQARAWNLAVEHYKVLSQAQAGKSKVEDAERRMNSLKKKVSVDGVTRKAAPEQDATSKLYSKAKDGTLNDKLAFIRKRFNTDGEIEKFLGS